MGGERTPEHAGQVRTDLVRLAWRESVAGGAFAHRRLAAPGIGFGEQDRQRLLRCSLLGAGGGLLDRDRQGIARVARALGREQDPRYGAEAQDESQRAEHRAGDLVDLERIHRNAPSRPWWRDLKGSAE
jgi:hypothetical protein